MKTSSTISSSPVQFRRSRSMPLLSRYSSSRDLYQMEENAAKHDEMLQRFQLRKVPSGNKLSRSTATTEAQVPPNQRFSLHRTLRSMLSAKTRKTVLRSLLSPISPRSWVSTVHGIIMLGVYHFQHLYLPFSASYYPHGSQGTTVVAVTLETIFLVDIVLHFNTTSIDKGVLITSRKIIARKYFHGNFMIDFLSAIPVQTMHSAITHSSNRTQPCVQVVHLALVVLRLVRVTLFEKDQLLSRVVRVASHLGEWMRYSRYSHLLGIAQLMWIVLLFAHYMACIWHGIYSSDEIHSSVVKQESVGEQYVADFYYAVSLIQGQGNVVGTWEENLYSSVAIILGSVILAIVFGNVAMLVSNFNANATNYHRKMESVYATMEKLRLPARLRERVKEYYSHVWIEYEALDRNINKFEHELTHTLGIEIGLYKHMDLVVRTPFFENCTPDFLTQLVVNLDTRVYMPNDYVVRRRETGSTMMIINRGYCKLSKPFVSASSAGNNLVTYTGENHDDSDTMSSEDEVNRIFGIGMFGASRLSGCAFDRSDPREGDFTDVDQFRQVHPRKSRYPKGAKQKLSKRSYVYLHPGEAFGEMSLLMNYKRTATVRALTFVEMCVLDRKTFQDIISRYPEDRRRVLTKMIHNCIEKKMIPLPWENIISSKRRRSDSRDIATMSATEVTRILVEEIDVNVPDESIKYGFQSFEQEFKDTPSFRNATPAIVNTLLHRNSGVRSTPAYSRQNSGTGTNDGSTSTSDFTETELHYSPTSIASDSNTALILLQKMAANLERLQQDVIELKNRGGCRCGPTSSPANILFVDSVATKEDPIDHAARKPSIVSTILSPLTPLPSSRLSKNNCLEKDTTQLQSSLTEDGRTRSADHRMLFQQGSESIRPKQPQVPVHGPLSNTFRAGGNAQGERYQASLSNRSESARDSTLTDLLWKRTNTNGDLLKHTEEEQAAARLRRQFQIPRYSSPGSTTNTPFLERTREQALPTDTPTAPSSFLNDQRLHPNRPLSRIHSNPDPRRLADEAIWQSYFQRKKS